MLVLACSVAHLCSTLCNPMDCGPRDSSVHGFSRQGYWSGWPCPPPGDLPNPGVETAFPASAALQADSSSLLSHQGCPGDPRLDPEPRVPHLMSRELLSGLRAAASEGGPGRSSCPAVQQCRRFSPDNRDGLTPVPVPVLL